MLEKWGQVPGAIDHGDPASDRDRPIGLLVAVDQWSDDCLGIDGHPIVETRYRDHLALSGMQFQRS